MTGLRCALIVFIVLWTGLTEARDCTNGKDWTVLVKTHNGTVSLLRDLTYAEARKVMRRLDPWPPREYHNCSEDGQTCWAESYVVRDGDVELLEAIGPSGCEMTVWTNEEFKTGKVTP